MSAKLLNTCTLLLLKNAKNQPLPTKDARMFSLALWPAQLELAIFNETVSAVVYVNGAAQLWHTRAVSNMYNIIYLYKYLLHVVSHHIILCGS